MSHELPPTASSLIAPDDDVATLHAMGYGQELLRRMSGFSNYAISFSTICIVAGGLTSFQLGFCSVGGASVGIGWAVGCLLSGMFALTMGQVASAFPTAGGLYHWGAILGGKGWGWATAWFNLGGLITVLAAINVGNYIFALGAFAPALGIDLKSLSAGSALLLQAGVVCAITLSQALLNHLGIRITTRLTDFSGYWILMVAVALTVSLLAYTPHLDFARLITFTNFSGAAGGNVWPPSTSMSWLFALGLLLPLYTITGFDASAHTAEETVGAARNVPIAIVRAVGVSTLAGWAMVSSIVLAMPNMATAASKGDQIFAYVVGAVLPGWLGMTLFASLVLAQYLCGLATLTSASRMVYAFARDGGLPGSRWLKQVSLAHRTPAIAIWSVALLTIVFTVYTPVYSTITAVCVIFLYVSYMLPTALGMRAYGRSWTQMGPWSIGAWYRPLAALCVLGCLGLIVIAVQPPNDKASWILAGTCVVLAVTWFGGVRTRFAGPPQGLAIAARQAEISSIEKAIAQGTGELEARV
jgi:amino acid transporter